MARLGHLHAELEESFGVPAATVVGLCIAADLGVLVDEIARVGERRGARGAGDPGREIPAGESYRFIVPKIEKSPTLLPASPAALWRVSPTHFRIRVGDDAGTDVKMQLLAFTDCGADGDVEAAFAVEAEATDRAGGGTAGDRLEFVDDFAS